MKFIGALIAIVIGVSTIVAVEAMPPIGIIASVRGKRIDIEAETVEEVSKCVEEKCGLDASEQSVLFRGKVLSPSDKLEDIGVAPGDTLNVVKVLIVNTLFLIVILTLELFIIVHAVASIINYLLFYFKAYIRNMY